MAVACVALAACGAKPNPSGPTTVTTNAAPPANPQIACPADMTLSGVAAATKAVTFTAPTVTGGTAPVTITCTPESGAAFPLGTTAVSCAATDAASRQASCAFNVTLKGFSIALTTFEAFGDSFTEGENALPSPTFVDTPNAYPTKLQARFDSVYPGQGVTVINRGHGGDPIEDPIATVTTLNAIIQRVPADRPQAVLVLSGYNNLLNGGCRVSDGQNPLCSDAIRAVAAGARDCIRHAREGSSSVSLVFVSTLTPAGPLVPPVTNRQLRHEAIEAVNAQIRQVVAAEGATLVDTYPTFLGHEAEYVSIDGLHLRPAGYQAIADAFFAAIQATVAQTPHFGFTAPR